MKASFLTVSGRLAGCKTASDIEACLTEVGELLVAASAKGYVEGWTRKDSDRFFESDVPDYLLSVLSKRMFSPENVAQRLPSRLENIARLAAQGVEGGLKSWVPIVLAVYTVDCAFWKHFEAFRPTTSPFSQKLIASFVDNVFCEPDMCMFDALFWVYLASTEADSGVIDAVVDMFRGYIEPAQLDSWCGYNKHAILRVFENHAQVCDKYGLNWPGKDVILVAVTLLKGQVMDRSVIGIQIINRLIGRPSVYELVSEMNLLEYVLQTDFHDTVLSEIHSFVNRLPESVSVSAELMVHVEQYIEKADTSQKNVYLRIFSALCSHLSVKGIDEVARRLDADQKNSLVSLQCRAMLSDTVAPKDRDVLSKICESLMKRCPPENYADILKYMGLVLTLPFWRRRFTDLIFESIDKAADCSSDVLDSLISYYSAEECSSLLEKCLVSLNSLDLIAKVLARCNFPLPHGDFQKLLNVLSGSRQGWSILINLAQSRPVYSLFDPTDWKEFIRTCNIRKCGVFLEMFEFLKGWSTPDIPAEYVEYRTSLVTDIAAFVLIECPDQIFDNAFEHWKNMFLSLDDTRALPPLSQSVSFLMSERWTTHKGRILMFLTKLIHRLDYIFIDLIHSFCDCRIPDPLPGLMYTVRLCWQQANSFLYAPFNCSPQTKIKELQRGMLAYRNQATSVIIYHPANQMPLSPYLTLGEYRIISACDLRVSFNQQEIGAPPVIMSLAIARAGKRILEDFTNHNVEDPLGSSQILEMKLLWNLVKLLPYGTTEIMPIIDRNPVQIYSVAHNQYTKRFLLIVLKRFIQDGKSATRFSDVFPVLISQIQSCSPKEMLYMLRVLMLPETFPLVRGNSDFLSALCRAVVRVTTAKNLEEILGYLMYAHSKIPQFESRFLSDPKILEHCLACPNLPLLDDFIASFSLNGRHIVLQMMVGILSPRTMTDTMLNAFRALALPSRSVSDVLIQKVLELVQTMEFDSTALKCSLELLLVLLENQSIDGFDTAFYRRLAEIILCDSRNDVQMTVFDIFRAIKKEQAEIKSVLGGILKDRTDVKCYQWNYDPTQMIRSKYTCGLMNQGATCYMNAVLQTLFHLEQFRSFILKTTTKQALVIALQELFSKMALSNLVSVDTSVFTQVWGTEYGIFDPHEQEDAESFLNSLLVKLPEEASEFLTWNVRTTFEGINVDFSKEVSETLKTLAINVKGVSSFAESMKQVELPAFFTGSNQYNSELYGPVDAKRFVKVVKVPEVLIVQLKRFDYDVDRHQRVKILDPLEVPMSFDIQTFFSHCPSTNFELSAVISHTGTADHGHYLAVVKKNGEWLCYNDEHVSPMNEDELKHIVNSSSAHSDNSPCGYLLVFTKAGTRSPDVDPSDLPEELRKEVIMENNSLLQLRALFTESMVNIIIWLEDYQILPSFYLNIVCHSCHFSLAKKFVQAIAKDVSKATMVGQYIANNCSSFVDVLLESARPIASSALKLFRFICMASDPSPAIQIIERLATLDEDVASRWRALEWVGKAFLHFTNRFHAAAVNLNLFDVCLNTIGLFCTMKPSELAYCNVVLWPMWQCLIRLKTSGNAHHLDGFLNSSSGRILSDYGCLSKRSKTLSQIAESLEFASYESVSKLCRKKDSVEEIENTIWGNPDQWNSVLMSSPELVVVCGIIVNQELLSCLLQSFVPNLKQSPGYLRVIRFLQLYVTALVTDVQSFERTLAFLVDIKTAAADVVKSMDFAATVQSLFFATKGVQPERDGTRLAASFFDDVMPTLMPEFRKELLDANLHKYLEVVCHFKEDRVIGQFLTGYRECFKSSPKLVIRLCRDPEFIGRFKSLQLAAPFFDVIGAHPTNSVVVDAVMSLYATDVTHALMLGRQAFSLIFNQPDACEPRYVSAYIEGFIRNIQALATARQVSHAIDTLSEVLFITPCEKINLTADDLSQALHAVSSDDIPKLCTLLVSICESDNDFSATAVQAILSVIPDNAKHSWSLWEGCLEICKLASLHREAAKIGREISNVLSANPGTTKDQRADRCLSLLATFVTPSSALCHMCWTTFLYMHLQSLPYGGNGIDEFLAQFFKSISPQELQTIISSFESRIKTGADNPQGSLQRSREILALARSSLTPSQ